MEGNYIIYGDQVDEMVFSLMEKSGALDRVQRNDVVFLKPNLVFSRRDWEGVDTDPRVVEAMIKALKERGVQNIVVGDGSGMGQSATKAFIYCGYDKMAKKYDIKLVDLERDEFVTVSTKMDGPFQKLQIARSIHDCDFFVNMPIIKLHYQTMITCSMKNLKGTMPRSMKTNFHSVDLHGAIAQLNSVLKPDLIVVDGLKGDMRCGMTHNIVTLERILVGENPIEIDSIAADILGYRPRDIPHIAYAADAGLGECDLEKIKIKSLNHPSKLIRLTAPSPIADQFSCKINAEGACSICMGNLIFALGRLQEEGRLSSRMTFHIGQTAKIEGGANVDIAVGTCVAEENPSAAVAIDACPPSSNEIYQSVLGL